MLEVLRIPVLTDNYIWIIHDPESAETVVVDPATCDEVIAETVKRRWKITQIWNTHWHNDHVGGNCEIKAATNAIITGPAAEADKIPSIDIKVGEGDQARIGNYTVDIFAMPAHTLGHIGYHIPQAQMVFVGDTLFAMGCGRLFEGTAAQMFTNMQRLAALPAETAVYCAHEYTLSNGRYALVAEPDNADIVTRMAKVTALRNQGEATIPTTIADELATNPFLRASSVDQLAERRTAKDGFRG